MKCKNIPQLGKYVTMNINLFSFLGFQAITKETLYWIQPSNQCLRVVHGNVGNSA